MIEIVVMALAAAYHGLFQVVAAQVGAVVAAGVVAILVVALEASVVATLVVVVLEGIIKSFPNQLFLLLILIGLYQSQKPENESKIKPQEVNVV